jgi:hypothetical protein
MKKILLLVLAVVALSGCISGPEEKLNETEIKHLMVDSAQNLETYRFQLENKQNVELVNLSDTNKTKPTIVSITSSGHGAVNLTGRALMVTTTTTATPEGENSSTTETESYFINDTMYIKLDGNWTMLSLPATEDIWNKQNMVKHQAELLNASKLSLLGSEKLDGEDCYKIKVVPDMYTFAQVLSEQMGSAMPVAFMNMSQLFRESEISWTSWVTKEGHILKKTETEVKLTITPEIMGMPVEAIGNFEMRMDMRATVLFQDFNKEIKIELPEEAKKASPYPIFAFPLTPVAT